MPVPEQSRRRRTRRFRLAIWSALTVCAMGVGTWALLLGIGDMLRAGELVSGGPAPVLPFGATMLLLGFGGLILGQFLNNIVMPYAGWELSDHLGSAVGRTGAAVGAAVAIPFYREPAQVGIGHATAPDAPWEWHHWLLYAVPVIVPAVLAVGAVFAFRRVVREVQETLSDEALGDHLLAHGQLTRGTITELEFRHAWLWDNPMFTVTFSYDAPTGTRTATRGLVTSPAEAPIVGGTVKVWYDAENPDPERIRVERDPDSAADPEGAQRYAPSN